MLRAQCAYAAEPIVRNRKSALCDPARKSNYFLRVFAIFGMARRLHPSSMSQHESDLEAEMEAMQ